MRRLEPTDLAIIDDETPRIQDARLGEVLGFERPRDIRKIVDRNRAEIEGYGPLRHRGAMVEIGSGAKREIAEFWLTEEQAILVTMFSRTARAAEARREIITVFVAYRRDMAEKPVKVHAHRRGKPSRFTEAAAVRRSHVALPTLSAYDWSNIALVALGELALVDPDRAEEVARELAPTARDRDFAMTAVCYRAMRERMSVRQAAH